MKIILLDGAIPGMISDEYFSRVDTLVERIRSRGHEISIFRLSELDIKSCTGCWGCWVKNPGNCVIPDDTVEIRNSVINGDFLLFASPLIMGFTSSVMKKTQDKLIPLLLPYIEFVEGECHHKPRYKQYPHLGLLYAPEEDSSNEDLRLLKDIYSRLALNFKSDLLIFEDIQRFIEKDTYEAFNHQRISQS